MLLCAGALSSHAQAGLRASAGTNFYVGSQVTASLMTDVFPYYDIVRSEFNIITDDRFKMKTMQPTNGVFSFAESDALVNWALSNGMVVRGHTLLYDHDGATPYWVWNLTGTWTQAEAMAILSNYITAVVSHFRGRVKYYDVVNEVILDNGAWKKSIWMDAIGPNFVALAFTWAHAADPDAVLYWNEQRCENLNLKAYAVWTNIFTLVTNGVSVHGFGTQAHVELGWYTSNATAITSNMLQYAPLGVEAQITECDVRIYSVDGVSRAEIMQQQRDYENIVRACRAASNCTAFVMWGFSDYYSWIPAFKPGYDQACIYDKTLRRKPAYYGVRNALLPVNAEFRCDEVGVQCTNTGTETAVLRLVGTNGAPVAARTAKRGGVSGRPYDWAIDTRAGTCLGVVTGMMSLAGARSLTLAAWYRPAQPWVSDAALLRMHDGSNGFGLGITPSGALHLEINQHAVAADVGSVTGTGQWRFAAATYDSGASGSNVFFYAGTTTGAVARVGMCILAAGAVGGAGTLFVGAADATGAQAARGQLDGLVIMGTNVTGAGALDMEALETLRRDAAVQTLPALLEYRCNETGTAALCSAFLTAGVVMKNSAGTAVDLHTVDGDGCTGMPGDRAFDNRASTGMGDGFTGGRAQQDNDEASLDRLWSFTVSGWIKPAVPLQGNAALQQNQEVSGFGYAVAAARGANARDLLINVDNFEFESSGDQFPESNEWIFVAASYDGTRTVSNAFLYKGTQFTPATCVGVGTINRGMTEPDGTRLVLGNMNAVQRPFDGLLDNLMLHASKFDGTGVLSAEELEQLRLRDALPEPGMIGLMGLTGLIWFGRTGPHEKTIRSL